MMSRYIIILLIMHPTDFNAQGKSFHKLQVTFTFFMYYRREIKNGDRWRKGQIKL